MLFGGILFAYSVCVADVSTTHGTGNSEGQEAASTAAPEETGQTNLLTVTWWDLMLDIPDLRQEFKLPRREN